ncbi:MAG: NAD(P)H-hydrate epimerase [Candidatus Limnocylindrales bacterium]
MTARMTPTVPGAADLEPLPTEDPALAIVDLDLDALVAHWASRASLSPMTAERMRGADARAQRLGVSGDRLMEHAGAAVAASARALIQTTERPRASVVLILCGPGNNGGDGFVAARHLAESGYRAVVALVATEQRPTTTDAARNWDRLGGVTAVDRIRSTSARDVQILMAHAERASIVVDALLGTGVRGPLREPIRTAVDLINRARSEGVPVLAVDTPTAIDLSSGVPSEPVVRADVTVTFHRPKVGLRGRVGRAIAGRILVAPIGIPHEADAG